MEVEISLSIIIGYMLGGINPAFILSKIKQVDMLQSGTGNLGTTNAFIHFGKGWGLFVLAMDWKYFLILLVIGCILAFVFNYGCSISFSAAVLFPIIMTFQMRLVGVFVLLTVCSGCIIYKHMDNIGKIRGGKEVPIRVFLKKYILKRG
ncbi:glycerol-3-phosphate acyltransferase [Kineothrix sedimenti]|uniref:Glycerol-3-phosphate acyltransferase n=1 Tax=Kineothrix sedimenti TaxID=3123317 RepID=A0ABZ3F062_9FIRM